jgi:phosphate transport system ATP-binding protein
MNTLNTTVSSETDMSEEKVVPVHEERPAETVIEEGQTVGTPYADDPKFKLRSSTARIVTARTSAWTSPAMR